MFKVSFLIVFNLFSITLFDVNPYDCAKTKNKILESEAKEYIFNMSAMENPNPYSDDVLCPNLNQNM